jgi:DNA-binding beta-propeller fold protein YncE
MIEEGVRKQECDTALGGRMAEVLAGSRCPSVQKTLPKRLTRGHFSWPKVLIAVALGVGVCLGFGLPMPDTIMLPDSLGPLRPGYHLAFGSSTNNIYVASESSDILVVDGSFTGSFQRIKRINTGTPVGGALLVSQHNKLYCTYPSRGRIGIIDCTTSDTVGSIQVSTRPRLLCYSSGSDKLYCGDSVNRKVWVIDCAADTVRKVISTEYGPTDMGYDPTTNKVYVVTKNSVLVIPCESDSITSSIGGEYRSGLCLNRRRQKLYVPGSVSPQTLCVVSTQSDSVTATIPNSASLLACNEATDRLYCTRTGSQFVEEYDCVGDTYTSYGYFPDYEGRAIACDTVYNRLLFRSVYDLLVADCTTFDVVANIGMPACDAHSDLLVLDPGRYRAVCPGRGLLLVFDYKSDTLCARGIAPLCGWATRMYHNPATSKLYCHLGGGVTAVVDELTNRMAKWVQGVGSGLVHSSTSNKLYYPVAYGPSYEYQGLGVVDGSTDSLIKVVGLGDFGWDPFPCWCPAGNKVYCFGEQGARLFIAVVDCSTDSVVRTMDMYDLGRWFEYLDNGLMLCNHSDSLALIDPLTDSVLVDSSLAAGAVNAVTHTGDGKKVYLVRFGRLEVRSSSSLTLLSTIEWSYFGSMMATSLVYSDTTKKLYWFVGGDSVLAIDVTRDTVAARIATSVSPGAARLDRTGRYLFCSCHDDSTLRVYDTQTDSLVALYPGLPYPLAVESSPEQHCIYVGCRDVILVYPDAPPGVEEAMNDERVVMHVPRTVVRGVLFLSGDREPGLGDRSALLDISGRRVLDLHPGVNDISRVAPGVYFVREAASGERSGGSVRKIMTVK